EVVHPRADEDGPRDEVGPRAALFALELDLVGGVPARGRASLAQHQRAADRTQGAVAQVGQGPLDVLFREGQPGGVGEADAVQHAVLLDQVLELLELQAGRPDRDLLELRLPRQGDTEAAPGWGEVDPPGRPRWRGRPRRRGHRGRPDDLAGALVALAQ